MRILFSLAVLFFASSATAQNWALLNIPFSARFDDVFFVNDSLGWTCNALGQIYRTPDGGKTWTLQFQSDNYMRSIEFSDASHGYCGGLAVGEPMYKTTDGGQTWVNISSDIPGITGGICGISCAGNGVVYGCGQWSAPAYVIKSTDNGNSWQKITLDSLATRLVDIYFTSPDTGWVSGTGAPISVGGVIIKTTDGGAHWKVLHQTGVNNDYVWKLQRIDDSIWVGSIERVYSPQANTQILRSTDNGETWNHQVVYPVHARLQMVGFLTPLHGWTGNDLLFETQDGGVTWQVVTIPQGGSYNRFWRFNDHSAIVTGNALFKYSAPVSVGTPPFQTPFKTPLNGDFHQLQVNPNPNRGQMDIRVQLNQKTQVILKIYSTDGRFEQTIWTGEHLAGEYHFPVNLTSCNSGAYVVYLKTNHGAQYVVTVVDKS